MNLESMELIMDWNRDDVAIPYRPPLDAETAALTFEQIAKKHPARCAIVAESNEELSYSVVNERATAIVRLLMQQRSVSPTSTADSEAKSPSIGCTLVALPRSTALPIALLAVVKSLDAYWAVDLTLQSPAVVARNRERLQCRHVIADATSLQLLFPDGLPIDVRGIVLNRAGEVERTVSGSLPISPIEDHLTIRCPQGTMYLEFTSGSTGQPKAVAVPHSCCIALCRNSTMYDWNEHTRSVLYHTVAFDVHVYDLWGPWMHGGAVIALEGSVTNVAMVLERTREAKATHLSMTPFGFLMMTKLHFGGSSSEQPSPTAGGASSLARLRTVMLCGEALDFMSLEPWFLHHPMVDGAVGVGGVPQTTSLKIFNSYGITETTVVNTFLHVTPERMKWPSSIGRRLPHTLFLLLDETGKGLVPHGSTGELYLAGDCVASGYITSTEKNDTCFVPVPTEITPLLASIAPWMRSVRTMYKSGDLASFHDEFGGFIYRGRADAEIKSAGFRVHPVEVEEHMNQMQSLKEAVVLGVTYPDGRKGLFAVVRRRTADVNKATVLTELRKKIADYKIPVMEFLEADEVLPLSGTNKVDRRLLTQWAMTVLALPQGAPRPPLPLAAA